MKHDLTTAQGVFGYFAEHTEILKPIQDEFLQKDIKIAELKAENLALKTDQVATLEAIAEIYEVMLGGAI